MGDLADLTPDEQRLLAVLTDPANDPAGTGAADQLLEDLQDMGPYLGYDAYADAETVANRLGLHHARAREQEGLPKWVGDLRFGFGCNTDGEINCFRVGVHLGDGVYLDTVEETKRLTVDRDAEGVAAALGYAVVIERRYLELLEMARVRGLLRAH